jgi:hypothetical protein
LQHILTTALEQTSALWSPITNAYEWVYRAATINDFEAQLTSDEVRHRFQELLETMQKWKYLAGELAGDIEHFLKVSRSYWSGLFHCYDIQGLPRTNNDLEHVFGKWRHHQRRCTGRKVAPASLVVRGSVQLVAAIATQLRSFTASELATVSVDAWQHVREDLEQHQRKRVQQRRFRSDPATYLASLEQKLLQLVLPV